MPLRVLAAKLTRVPLREGALSSLSGHNSNSSRHHHETLRDEQQNCHGERVTPRHKAPEYLARSGAQSKEVKIRLQAAASNHGATGSSRKTTQ